jgi:hypothetical protein
MIEPSEIPDDLAACQALIRAQAATLSQYAAAVSEHTATIAEQAVAVSEHSATVSEHAATIASQERKIEELSVEMEKIRKLLSHFVNGHRSEKRVLTGPDQQWLPFENSAEFQAARAEAEAQAAAVVQTYTVQRTAAKKKPRDESLPAHLRREEQIVESDAAQQATTRPRRWSTRGPNCTCW